MAAFAELANGARAMTNEKQKPIPLADRLRSIEQTVMARETYSYDPRSRKHPRTKPHRPTHRKKKMLALRRQVKKMPPEDVLHFIDTGELRWNETTCGKMNMSMYLSRRTNMDRLIRSVHADLIQRLLDLCCYW